MPEVEHGEAQCWSQLSPPLSPHPSTAYLDMSAPVMARARARTQNTSDEKNATTRSKPWPPVLCESDVTQ